jgi:hypothetical protein
MAAKLPLDAHSAIPLGPLSASACGFRVGISLLGPAALADDLEEEDGGGCRQVEGVGHAHLRGLEALDRKLPK